MKASPPNLFQEIDAICKRPNLYLLKRDLNNLSDYLGGFCAAKRAYGNTEDDTQLHTLQKWFEQRFTDTPHFGGSQCFATILLSYCDGDRDRAFNVFVEYWEEFKTFSQIQNLL